MHTLGNKGYGKKPQPGELNKIIHIGITENVQDEHGYPTAQDRVLYRLFAKLENRATMPITSRMPRA